MKSDEMVLKSMEALEANGPMQLSKLARKQPVRDAESDAKRAEKRIGTPQFKQLLAASMAIRPNVRTALRTPMPWQ